MYDSNMRFDFDQAHLRQGEFKRLKGSVSVELTSVESHSRINRPSERVLTEERLF